MIASALKINSTINQDIFLSNTLHRWIIDAQGIFHDYDFMNMRLTIKTLNLELEEACEISQLRKIT
ncbi:predicted protein [Sclerotinia sclerotiorum 1980 UF-70]|uniref:Uncharacterized protein n=1 Tax=Sclerotinia sclerotiorum (strain ATCC 18683 / 1980 / Ss-1) TaxID=665079 RepID=A7F096_SCLS1|nr:predicted protein [Sclerotinia sclerotiorum 1980 UF-70]EDN95138.1 predicted protein [Sclerotinia sclerotiorum 1980 UF-70]